MSNTKKSKKLRTPNVPKAGVRLAPPSVTAAPAAPANPRARVAPGLALRSARPSAAAPAEFDYTYIKHDLRRIAILAGSFIVILVGLSFFIR
ncbi:MAG: hypothetical protein ABI847_07920 [Anaerolineales bacterium]